MRVAWRPSRPATAALVVGFAVTTALSAVAYVINDHTENRLLRLQTAEVGAVLQVVVPVIETPLASAAQIAATSHGAEGPFRNYITAYTGGQGPFAGVSLWQVSGSTARMLYGAGVPPALSADPATAATFLGQAARRPTLQVTGPLGSAADPRLGYAYSAGGAPTYVVYAESKLPPNRRAPQPSSSAFADLDFALYLGSTRLPARLIETNTGHVPLRGRTAVVTVPFGATSLTLVARPKRTLAGALPDALWWIAAVVGGVMSIAFAATAERLTRRRAAAESLTARVEELLHEQRDIAGSLQESLLPAVVPGIDGVDLALRYVPGEEGVSIGGDWYDVVPLDPHRFFFVVGDVSGRGIEAATVMASLRFAIRGFVSEGHQPGAVLDCLARMAAQDRTDAVATVLCGIVDVPAHRVTIANAGHLPPLVVGPDGADYVDAPIGPPIGVGTSAGYVTGTADVARHGTLLCYTDGLVERRDEGLDIGLERLKVSAGARSGTVEDTVSTVVRDVGPEIHDDDIAILAVRWLD